MFIERILNVASLKGSVLHFLESSKTGCGSASYLVFSPQSEFLIIILRPETRNMCCLLSLPRIWTHTPVDCAPVQSVDSLN